MKIGFYNSCLMDWDLDKTFGWARDHGFEGLELYGGPRYPYVSWEEIASGKTNPLLEAQERYGIPVAGLMFGALPFLSPDESERKEALQYLEVLLRAASRSNVEVVSTFTGRDPLKTLDENLDLYAEVFPQVAEMAERYEVNLAFENCPMYEYWPPVHNIAVSPVIWNEMFVRVPSERFGLNLDPSHLVWQGVDYAQAVRDFEDRIWLAQAKDTEVLHRVLREEGMLTLRWWRHRIPGQGDVRWDKFVSSLHEAGYEGVLSIEHEDPVWTGSDEKVTRGLLLARSYLDQFV